MSESLAPGSDLLVGNCTKTVENLAQWRLEKKKRNNSASRWDGGLETANVIARTNAVFGLYSKPRATSGERHHSLKISLQ